MKKNLALVLSLMVFACFAETIKHDFSKKGWGTWKSKETIAKTSHDKTVGNTAPGSLKITLGPNNPLNKSVCFLSHLPIKPGKNYTASVWYKTNGTAEDIKVSMSFQGLDAKRQFLNNGVYGTKKSAAGEWTRMVYSMKVPEKKIKWDRAAFLICTLSVSNSAEGEVWFDDFEFQEDIEEDEE